MKKLPFVLLFTLILFGCRYEKPLITNSDRLKDMDRMLKIQKQLTSNSLKPIWTVFDKPVSKNEEQALTFLFAYMPLSDLADYSPEFMLANVRQSLLAKKDMAWGDKLPEGEFLHFVLPLRVNNENLDSFRLVYYEEIKARIHGLSMKEAALEINHWCHGKVNYHGTDARTSAPMSTIKKTFGRCGEESTLTVTALRTAGIPARQVYTPRWAHTDDNHAWVEVWIDGKWHFLGACEPDADLDRGWFSEPSQRTMLVHTRTYGRYWGSEEVLDTRERFSELNLTANYATTKVIPVFVSNSDGTAAEGVKVEFKLYNYAEFFSLATLTTNGKGFVRFTTGLGDLLVWVSKGDLFAFKKLNVCSTDTLRLVLNKNRMEPGTAYFDMVPPKVSKAINPVSDQDKKINDCRLSQEDSIRNKTMTALKDSDWIRCYAKSHQMAEDTLMRVLRLSYGNWREIIEYLEKNQATARNQIFPLLNGISDKDLSDTKAAVLTDHLTGALANGVPAEMHSELFEKYILAPRIDLEMLSPWRNFLLKQMGPEMAAASRNNIIALTDWIKTNIHIDPVANKHSRSPLTPIGVYNLRVADPLSRDIFFVAACRAFSIPSRLNPETRVPEYYKAGIWSRVDFEKPAAQPKMGKLTLVDKDNNLPPQYSLHFTIAIIENGICKTLEFDEGRKLTDFPNPLLLETGHYVLVTGKRLSGGSVLSSLTFFDITGEKPTLVEVTLRQPETTVKPADLLDPTKIHLTETASNRVVTLSDLMGKCSSVIAFLDPGSEPSKHILNDLAPYINQFNHWKGRFILVYTPDKQPETSLQSYKLPATTCFTVDTKNEFGQAFTTITGKDARSNLPVILFCQSSGLLLLTATGYKIGMGEELLQLIKSLDTNCVLQPKDRCTKH